MKLILLILYLYVFHEIECLETNLNSVQDSNKKDFDGVRIPEQNKKHPKHGYKREAYFSDDDDIQQYQFQAFASGLTFDESKLSSEDTH
ncbi:unnamed protein product [Orchesella dallaii]|uniref:Uncharacterized protein n=1 Tax=Orchesella dallaii TaxID=48710 RepID=A0ABP1Q681_9HEXA